MRRSLVAALIAVVLLAVPVWGWAEPSMTRPTPRQVADKMVSMCFSEGATIVGPSDPNEAGAVIVTLADGTFAIKEYDVVRARNFAAIFLSRNPIYSLLYVTFPEKVGNGHLDTASDSFQRKAVDCFYGAYIGQDVIQ